MNFKAKTEDVPHHPPQCPQLPPKIGPSHKSEETLKVFYGEMVYYKIIKEIWGVHYNREYIKKNFKEIK